MRAFWYMVHILLENLVGRYLPTRRIGIFMYANQPSVFRQQPLPQRFFFVGTFLRQQRSIKVSKGPEVELISKLNEYAIPTDQVSCDFPDGK